MQENKFEKDVRQRLDGLHLTPSEPVWQNVEAAIKKKKKRRLVVWLLPFLFLAGGVVWWQMAPWQHKATDAQQARETPRQSPGFSKPHATEEAKKAKSKTPVFQPQSKPDVSTEKAVNRVALQQKKSLKDAVEGVTLERRIGLKRKELNTIEPEKKGAGKSDKISRHRLEDATAEISGKSVAGVVQPPFTAKTKAENATTTTIKAKDTASQKIVKHTTSLKGDSLKTVVQPIDKKRGEKKNLQWSIAARIGGSNMAARLFKGFNLNKSLRQSDTQPDNYNAGNMPGSDSAMRRQAALPAKGLQFSIGSKVKKSIGKNRFFIAGLQYGFYSNRLSVGMQLPADSVAALFNSTPELLNGGAPGAQKVFRNNSGNATSANNSAAGTNTRFTNAFHFIELPVGFEYRLLKKAPLQIQHGIVVSRLIGSRVLQYDSRTDTYYQSKKGLRKTNIAAFTAVTYAVWKNKTILLQAGPHLQYSLQSVLKNAPRNHMVSGGVALNMAF